MSENFDESQQVAEKKVSPGKNKNMYMCLCLTACYQTRINTNNQLTYLLLHIYILLLYKRYIT